MNFQATIIIAFFAALASICTAPRRAQAAPGPGSDTLSLLAVSAYGGLQYADAAQYNNYFDAITSREGAVRWLWAAGLQADWRMYREGMVYASAGFRYLSSGGRQVDSRRNWEDSLGAHYKWDIALSLDTRAFIPYIGMRFYVGEGRLRGLFGAHVGFMYLSSPLGQSYSMQYSDSAGQPAGQAERSYTAKYYGLGYLITLSAGAEYRLHGPWAIVLKGEGVTGGADLRHDYGDRVIASIGRVKNYLGINMNGFSLTAGMRVYLR